MNDDKQIGLNLQRIREEAGLSQKQLAAAVKKAGPRWSQTTVWAVEAGERPLRLTEALLLGNILEVNYHSLVRDTEQGEYEIALNNLIAAHEELVKALDLYEMTVLEAKLIRDKVTDEDLANDLDHYLNKLNRPR